MRFSKLNQDTFNNYEKEIKKLRFHFRLIFCLPIAFISLFIVSILLLSNTEYGEPLYVLGALLAIVTWFPGIAAIITCSLSLIQSRNYIRHFKNIKYPPEVIVDVNKGLTYVYGKKRKQITFNEIYDVERTLQDDMLPCYLIDAKTSDGQYKKQYLPTFYTQEDILRNHLYALMHFTKAEKFENEEFKNAIALFGENIVDELYNMSFLIEASSSLGIDYTNGPTFTLEKTPGLLHYKVPFNSEASSIYLYTDKNEMKTSNSYIIVSFLELLTIVKENSSTIFKDYIQRIVINPYSDNVEITIQ